MKFLNIFNSKELNKKRISEIIIISIYIILKYTNNYLLLSFEGLVGVEQEANIFIKHICSPIGIYTVLTANKFFTIKSNV